MAKFEIIKMGDREGNGAVVKKTGFFGSSTWTANNEKAFEKWVCRETGDFEYKGPLCALDFFYKAQYDTRQEVM